MAAKNFTLDEHKETLAIYAANNWNVTKAADALGIPRTTFSERIKNARRTLEKHGKTQFEVTRPPDEKMPTEELVEWRKKQFDRKARNKESAKLLDVKVKVDGPIGIAHFGDPHVDDDGTDIGLLEHHMKVCRETPGFFAANLGDLQNNWVGRLARLWAQQSTSHAQAWQLVEWMLKGCDWLYLVGGNHDAWSGEGDPLKWIMKNANTAFQYHGARLALRFPNKKEVRINARHDFKGHSMWNPAHGPMKAAQGGWRDHILTCGHKHTSFVAGPLKDPANGLLSWAIRCAGYKTYDRYAEELGLADQNAFPTAVTIIDPQFEDDDPRLVTVITDVDEGAEFLTWKRKKAGV